MDLALPTVTRGKTEQKTDVSIDEPEDFGHFKIERDYARGHQPYRFVGSNEYFGEPALNLLRALYAEVDFVSRKDLAKNLHPQKTEASGEMIVGAAYSELARAIVAFMAKPNAKFENPLVSVKGIGLRFFKIGDERIIPDARNANFEGREFRVDHSKTQDFGYFKIECAPTRERQAYRFLESEIYLSQNAMKLLRELYAATDFIPRTDLAKKLFPDKSQTSSEATIGTTYAELALAIKKFMAKPNIAFENPLVSVKGVGLRFFTTTDKRVIPDPRKHYISNTNGFQADPSKTEDFGYFKVEADLTQTSKNQFRIQGTDVRMSVGAMALLRALYAATDFIKRSDYAEQLYPKFRFSNAVSYVSRDLTELMRCLKRAKIEESEKILVHARAVGFRFFKKGEPRTVLSVPTAYNAVKTPAHQPVHRSVSYYNPLHDEFLRPKTPPKPIRSKPLPPARDIPLLKSYGPANDKVILPAELHIKNERNLLRDGSSYRQRFDLAASCLDNREFAAVCEIFLRHEDFRKDAEMFGKHLGLTVAQVHELVNNARNNLLSAMQIDSDPVISSWSFGKVKTGLRAVRAETTQEVKEPPMPNKDMSQKYSPLAMEAVWVGKNADMRAIFNVASDNLSLEATQIIARLYLREQRYRSAPQDIANDMGISLARVHEAAVQGRDVLMPLLSDKQREIIAAWPMKTNSI